MNEFANFVDQQTHSAENSYCSFVFLALDCVCPLPTTSQKRQFKPIQQLWGNFGDENPPKITVLFKRTVQRNAIDPDGRALVAMEVSFPDALEPPRAHNRSTVGSL